MKLISDLRQLYSNALVYEDVGQVITKCGKVERRTEFETKFCRPNFQFSFVAEYLHDVSSKQTGSLSSDGKNHSFAVAGLSSSSTRQFPSLSFAIGAATAYGGGIANLIATLLLPTEDFSNIFDLCFEAREESIEGTECYKLVSASEEGDVVELWISKPSLTLVGLKESSKAQDNDLIEQQVSNDACRLFGSAGELYKEFNQGLRIDEDCRFNVRLLHT